MFSRRFASAASDVYKRQAVSIIREQEVRIMQNGKTKGILLHGFITKEEISIIMNTGLIMILTEKGNW